MNMTLSEELKWRGFVNQTTYSDLTVLDGEPISFYFGVDPSAFGMQIGNLAAAMMVRHFCKHGHKAYVLVGGATGMIGDPDGKKDERNLKTFDEISNNKAEIARQYAIVLDGQEFTVVDNYDWFKSINYLDFLRDIGKHVPMSSMLGRDFIQTRLGEGGSGISYAEFSYALIQGYDFLHLHREFGVTLQLCGADQWGNSIAGVDIIRRIESAEAHVYSTPLVINKATGVKFGKTEGGAVWLDPNQTSVFKFYQFWLNLDDAGVEDYLKIYTELEKSQIESLMDSFNKNRAERLAQKTLAFEVTKIVHGTERAESVRRISDVLFGSGDYKALTAEDMLALSEELPVHPGVQLIEILTETGLASSNSDARRFMQGNAVYVNGVQISAEKLELESADFLHGFALIRRGKNSMALARQ